MPTPADARAPLGHATVAYRQLDPRKQASILRAATEEFADKGYSRASMNTLVRSAGISKGSLFQYFRSKQDLFLGLLELATGEVQQWLRQVREETRGRPLPERLGRLLESGVQFIRSHPRLARLYFQLLQSGDAPFGDEQLKALHRRSRKFLTGILEEAAQRGELRPGVDVERAAFLVDTLFERFLQASYQLHLSPTESNSGEQPSLEAWIDDLVDLLCGGLCGPVPRVHTPIDPTPLTKEPTDG
jgi:TetR/AcrR family transcriptional regulator